jgi:hypothetical protein
MLDPPCKADCIGNANTVCTAQAPSRQILLISVSFVVFSRARLLGANDSAVKFGVITSQAARKAHGCSDSSSNQVAAHLLQGWP